MAAIAAASLRILLDDDSVFKFNQEQTNQHLFEEKEAGPRNRKASVLRSCRLTEGGDTDPVSNQ